MGFRQVPHTMGVGLPFNHGSSPPITDFPAESYVSNPRSRRFSHKVSPAYDLSHKIHSVVGLLIVLYGNIPGVRYFG